MLRRTIYGHGLVTDGWVSIDPADEAIIEGVYKKSIREGEEKLMAAVLQDAVECFQQYVFAESAKEKKLFQEAEEWFLDKDSDGLFSFKNICETLQLHPDYIREGLMSWKEAKLKDRSIHQVHVSRENAAKTRVTRTSVRLSKTA